MAAATVDPVYLSTYLDVPQATVTSVLDSPTVELVNSVLLAVTLKARQHEELQADKLRIDIELENAVRGADSRAQGLKATADKALKDVEELRQQLKNQENTRSALEAELQALKSSSSTSTSEVESLNARILSLESANRDTIAVLEAKTTANDVLAQDLQKQHQKALDLGQQVTALQQSIQHANSAASSAKFREQNLQQELELAKRNNEWFENELKTKSAEALKFRKEKGARIAELQRQNEELNSSITAAKRTEQSLRTRLDEVQKKAEDSFAKIQQLQESTATLEEDFRQEREKSKRLADLQDERAETERTRRKDLEDELEKTKDEMAEQIGFAQQDAEAEHARVVEAEGRIAELQSRIDQLEAAGHPFPGSVPGTPRQGLNGSTMSRPGTPGSARKSTITATQALSELYKVKAELASERRTTAQLQEAMDELVEGLESKQPEIEEMQAEHQRLQQEVIQMSRFVDQTGKEREKAKKDARTAQNEANAAQTEARILRQQSRDLSVQIKILLCELEAREHGIDAMNAAEKAQLERVARGEIGEEALQGQTDTDKLISQRLTIFRNVSELQEKNIELLRLTRTLGAQMENNEALAQKHQAAEDHEQILTLQQKVQNLKDELNSVVILSDSYVKERDMFRRMLQQRGQLPAAHSDLESVFGQSVDEDVVQSIEQSPNTKNNADLAKVLRKQQRLYDQYKEEDKINQDTLRQQAQALATEKSSLQAENAKLRSEVAREQERFEMLQGNYQMLQTENKSLQDRFQQVSENAAKQDIRTQQVAEDLIEAKGDLEGMRNENANLKAEKKLWKEIQERLGKENESLMNERSRLNNLIANQQSLQNEREISDSETRRRLTTTVENLESELNLTKRKLNEEVEENKKSQLRREYHTQQTQKRVDVIMSSLSAAREELVGLKTTKDHLQARVDELVIELKSAEERVQVLQPRPTPRPANQEDAAQDAISREQELAIEVSELKRDLDLAKTELENTRTQNEQYQQISQQAEEELRGLSETYELYQTEMEKVSEGKETKIRELQQRVEDISSELATTNDELTGLRNEQSELKRRFDEEKVSLETEITRLTDAEEHARALAQFHQKDLRAQAEIATKAQQDYETELVKHAEAAKTLHSLRAEHNQLKSEVLTFKTEAESAKVTLAQNESSWEERKEQFERESAKLRTRRDEIDAQNKLLHQQLESMTSQISALQQSRATFTNEGELEPIANGGANDRSVEDLRELVKYLRREKEIVDVQYDLSQQEAKRVKQQLDYAKSQLDEAKLQLQQERARSTDQARSSMSHKDLMEKLNELNLFRESSITLRNEARQAQSQLAEKAQRVEELLGKIQPLEARIGELENLRETQDGEMRLLQEDRDRWQKRTQDIISKYDRIDPAEMEQLKENLATLTAERDALIAEQQPLREAAESFEEEKKRWQASREKLIDQSKNRNREQNKIIADRSAERDLAIQEKDSLSGQLYVLRQELDVAIKEKGDVEQRLESLKEEMESVKSDKSEAAATAGASSSIQPETAEQSAASVEQLAPLQQELQTVKQSKEALEKELASVRAELNSARQEFETVTAERDQALAKASAVQLTPDTAKVDGNAQGDAEEGQVAESPPTPLTDDERQALEARIVAAEARVKELEAKIAEMEANNDAVLKARSDKMKSLLNKKLTESKETLKETLQKEYEDRLAQDKVIWMAEHAAPAAPAASKTAAVGAPSTPVKTNGDVEESTPGDTPDLSDKQVRHLLTTNPTIKNIVAHNLKKKLEVEVQKLKEESDAKLAEIERASTQKLADAEKKAEDVKLSAVGLESKKSTLKINMAENKFKQAQAKIQVVETAAKETPEKPVGEVWAVAQHAKPAIPPPAVNKDVSAKPSPTPTAAPAPQVTAKVEPASTGSSIPHPAAHPPTGPAAINGSLTPTNTSSVPVPTQPAGNRVTSGSGIPQPRGGANTRGIARGGNRGSNGGVYSAPGGGRGRGFNPNNNNNNQGGSSRPGSGMGMNPFAQPYSPGAGNKRPRDDSMGGHDGNGAKRTRGGGRGGQGQE